MSSVMRETAIVGLELFNKFIEGVHTLFNFVYSRRHVPYVHAKLRDYLEAHRSAIL
jgi:hypothetical protein